ncbi:hypothetical protein [Amycolatopsis pigmentata]|uniref:Uncharacterized protein n=1 Tax=Amycolatopsis pigmentata TaxID=450801 RepID=A0ABW5G2M7_9PSEU
MTGVVTKAPADDLMVEWCGPHALVRCRQESAGDRLLAAVPARAGHLAVLPSAAAQRHPELESTIYGLLRSVLQPERGIHTVWLAIPGLGTDQGAWAPLVRRLISEFTIDIVAPDGPVAGSAGSGIYVGPGIGAAGWRRFHSGSPSAVVSTRFPVPAWERALPAVPVSEAGVVVEPVGAGLLMRGAPAPPLTPAHPAFRVPVDQGRPKLIIEGGRILPGQAGVLLDMIPPAVRATLLYVPLDPALAGLGWVSLLAERCKTDIVFSAGAQLVDPGGDHSVVTGVGLAKAFRPFPTILRQRPGVLEQEVLDIAPPPSGWRRYAARGYRIGSDGPVIDVVPGGLVLREDAAPVGGLATRAPFDPYGWTLTVGVPGTAVSRTLVEAFERLLAGAGGDRLRTVRVRTDGELDDQGRERIEGIARHAGVPLELPAATERPSVVTVPAIPLSMSMVSGPATAPPTTTEPETAQGKSQGSEANGRVEARTAGPRPPQEKRSPRPHPQGTPETQPPAAPEERPLETRAPVKKDVTPAVTTKTAVPPAPVPPARPVVPPVPPAAPVVPPVPPAAPVASPVPPAAPPKPAGPVPAVSAPPLPVSMVSGPAPVAPVPPGPAAPVAPSAPDPAEETTELPKIEDDVVEEPAPDDDDVVVTDAEPWPVRASTSAEQGKFSAAAGNAFTDGLSLVNSALATWPALRRRETGAKADYVAVCLYLTRGPSGAVSVNRALRAGREVPLDAYTTCLVSGLARLPIHRRAVLRQARTDPRWPVGTILTDPGFVSASVGYDALIAEAEADLLIWPVSARRTTELVLNRPIEEAVFLPGRRFKVLETRTLDEPREDVEGQPVPTTTVLLREIAPGESDVDAADASALARLDRAWQLRQRSELRLITDSDMALRLTMPMVVADTETAGNTQGHTGGATA